MKIFLKVTMHIKDKEGKLRSETKHFPLGEFFMVHEQLKKGEVITAILFEDFHQIFSHLDLDKEQ